MRKFISTLCLLTGLSIAGQAQNGYKPAYPFELGLQLGTTTFLGDLGGTKFYGRPFLPDTDFKAIRPAIGIYGRWNIGAFFTARLDLNFLMLRGDDEWAGRGNDYSPSIQPLTGEMVRIDPQTGIRMKPGAPCAGCIEIPEVEAAWFRRYRNMDFRSRVFEASISGEIIPYNFELGGGYQGYSVISPYATVGIGIFNYKPQGLSPDGYWVDLKPLRTEGQGFVDGRTPYALTQMNVPLGFGAKWIYNDQWALSLEVNHRLTFTDYIDDVSTDYVNPQVFYDNMPLDQARLAEAMARRSQEWDTGEANGYITQPGEQRGDPKDNDSYYTITVRFGYFIDPASMGGGRRYGCPVW